jgi:hypothetical protein
MVSEKKIDIKSTFINTNQHYESKSKSILSVGSPIGRRCRAI